MQHLALFLSLLLANVAIANDFPGFPLQNIRVIDGDTIQADIVLPWAVTLRAQMIRASDYDAWESTKRRQSVEVTDEEVRLGERATEALDRLQKGTTLYARPDTEPRDNYGRVLARLYYEDRDGRLHAVADVMRDGGHLRTGGD